MNKHIRKNRVASNAFVGLMAVMVVIGVSSCSSEPNSLRGVVITPPPSVANVDLSSNAAPSVPLLPGPKELQLVYFGFTHCPDVCPTTLAALKRALAKIGPEKSKRIGLLMVTVDPKRDRPAVLREYLDFFNESWKPVVIDDPPTLRSMADAFGADYEVTTNASDGIDVSHTGALYAVDETGHIVVHWPFDADVGASDVIAHDLELLLT